MGKKITAKNIKITVSGNSFDYTGKEVRYDENGIDPIIVTKTTVSGNEIVPVAELEEGKDYKLVYKNNINQGKATISVVGINAYTGKKDIKFTIKKEELNWLAALTELLDNLFLLYLTFSIIFSQENPESFRGFRVFYCILIRFFL